MTRPSRTLDITIDGVTLTVHDVSPPTRASLYDPGDPWEWGLVEVTGGYLDPEEDGDPEAWAEALPDARIVDALSEAWERRPWLLDAYDDYNDDYRGKYEQD